MKRLQRYAFYGAISVLSSVALLFVIKFTTVRKQSKAKEDKCLEEQINSGQSDASMDFNLNDIKFITEKDVQNEMIKLLSEEDFVKSIPLVLDSWSKLKPNNLQPAISKMYELFRKCDHLAALVFDSKVDWSNQKTVFCAMLGTLMSNCGNPESLAKMIIPLGERHKFLLVKPTYYDSMRKTLIFSVKEILSEKNQWDSAYESAWHTFFKTISKGMILAGDKMLIN